MSCALVRHDADRHRRCPRGRRASEHAQPRRNEQAHSSLALALIQRLPSRSLPAGHGAPYCEHAASARTTHCCLTSLHELEVNGWTCEPGLNAESFWLAIGSALFRMDHRDLTDLCLDDLRMPHATDLQSTTPTLASQTLLRQLTITGTGENSSRCDEHQAASLKLTRALCAPTRLQQLTLGALCPFLQSRYSHLRRLTQLRELGLNYLSTEPPTRWPAPSDGCSPQYKCRPPPRLGSSACLSLSGAAGVTYDAAFRTYRVWRWRPKLASVCCRS